MAEAGLRRYSTVAVILHWAIAVLVIAQVWFGWQMGDGSRDERAFYAALHLPTGVTILVLTLARLAWRLIHPPPPFPPVMRPWERGLAHTVHALFYVLLIVMPLTGWITVSAHEAARPIDVWGLVELAPLEPFASMERHLQDDVHDLFEETHHFLAKVVVYGLIPLHVLGALKHQFIDGQDEFWRMLPFLPRRGA